MFNAFNFMSKKNCFDKFLVSDIGVLYLKNVFFLNLAPYHTFNKFSTVTKILPI